MNKIIPGKTIVLNTKTNTTFVAHDFEASIHNWLERPNDKHIEWAGELSIAVAQKEYRKIAEDLWQLLDDIDTASDLFKPSETNGIESYKNFYDYAMKKQAERWQMLIGDDKNPNKLVIHPTYPKI